MSAPEVRYEIQQRLGLTDGSDAWFALVPFGGSKSTEFEAEARARHQQYRDSGLCVRLVRVTVEVLEE